MRVVTLVLVSVVFGFMLFEHASQYGRSRQRNQRQDGDPTASAVGKSL